MPVTVTIKLLKLCQWKRTVFLQNGFCTHFVKKTKRPISIDTMLKFDGDGDGDRDRDGTCKWTFKLNEILRLWLEVYWVSDILNEKYYCCLPTKLWEGKYFHRCLPVSKGVWFQRGDMVYSTLPYLTSSGGHWSGRYVSNCNVVLIII